MTQIQLPYSEPVRLHQIGASLERTLVPEAADLVRIAKALNLASLASLSVDMTLVPTVSGFRMDGRVKAEAEQTCGLSLEPMPVSVDRPFTVYFVHEAEPQNNEDGEIDIELDDNFPDVIEDGKIDLGQHAVEQLSLSLDPFPRKEGAVFVQPPEPVDISPFAALKALKDTSQG
jgi:uncharacterized metal-binding protein YceD (DUF177 family)